MHHSSRPARMARIIVRIGPVGVVGAAKASPASFRQNIGNHVPVWPGSLHRAESNPVAPCWPKRNRHMLGFIFGLNARLGRLHYFLATIVLAVVMTGLCFLVAFSVFQTAAHGAQPSFEMVKGPVIGLAALFGVISFTLQSMRIRDIGWDPV